ncbi:MAG: GTPase ObgE [Bacteroidales bacterium]|nr:GTPase ObgE [Bacteroidales bacterium]
MSESNFVDYIKIFCRSGRGGKGSAHLRREKFNPKGGPDGGDGGRGGHIILRGNSHLWTLLHLRYRKHIFAVQGQDGMKDNKTGKTGDDVIIEVPLGTVARDAETGTFLLEILNHGEQQVLVKGGKGGLGNTHFKSATNQTPRYAQPGEPAIEGWYSLELKILADVGLVGLPNAGKSTLLSVISAAKPKIAEYPFTTLVPNLGIVRYRNDLSFVVADIPGIIEGAHEGRGLGLRFLRHIERNSILLFMIPVDSNDILREYEILLHELRQYNPELLDKKRVLSITKCDLADQELISGLKSDLPDMPFVFISAHTGQNLQQLKNILWGELNIMTDD